MHPWIPSFTLLRVQVPPEKGLQPWKQPQNIPKHPKNIPKHPKTTPKPPKTSQNLPKHLLRRCRWTLKPHTPGLPNEWSPVARTEPYGGDPNSSQPKRQAGVMGTGEKPPENRKKHGKKKNTVKPWKTWIFLGKTKYDQCFFWQNQEHFLEILPGVVFYSHWGPLLFG